MKAQRGKSGASRWIDSMVIDVHCHIGFSSRPLETGASRFSFEEKGASGRPGFDSYFSPRLLRRPVWRFLPRVLGLKIPLFPGPELDAAIGRIMEQHWSNMPDVDRLVLLAFDEYHDDAGRVHGPVDRGVRFGGDLYVSNSFVRAFCDRRPDQFLFGASIHPYRTHEGRDACSLLEEVAAARPALIKWLPIHQNIRAEDPRTVAFLRAAARLGIPLLVHYGGEMSLSRQHMEFESPLPMLDVLRGLRREGAMPTVIVAHAATPSFPWESARYHETFLKALIGEFNDAPLYADISALAAFGRTGRLRRLASRRDLHRKLVWGSDFPILPLLWPFVGDLGWRRIRALRRVRSWVQRDLELKRAMGFDECVFSQATRILNPT